MNQRLKDEARAALVRAAPDIAVGIAERLIEAPVVQHWFDRIERRRPRGIVAWVRRLRGKERGLSDEQRRELEEFLREKAQKYR